jgi:ketosteroid isomerase-like protein
MNEVAILAVAYAAFNARDIDAVTAFMHPNVEWPNGMDGEHHSPRI